MGRDSVTSLAPGFRFHPTDEELVRYYLRRKVCNKPFKFDAISVVDIYRSEPWDLPDKSKLKSRDLEWYFFSVLDKKYGNGSKTNRATEKGYWKTTGKDREIRRGSRTTGMKKTLVYHKGRAPRGERTNWVMHEYRLVDEELQKAGIPQDAFVLCRVFQKSGSGPKNGEQYGAPFVEEEWEDDVMAFIPDQDVMTEEVAGGDDIYFDIDEFEQKPEKLLVHENVPAPSNFYYGESSKNAESSNNIDSGNLVESGGFFDQSGDFSEEDQKPFIGSGRTQWGPGLPEDQVDSGLPEENNLNLQSSDNEFTAGTSYAVNSDDTNYLLHEPYEDDKSNLPFDDGLCLQAVDLGNACDVEDFNFDEYLKFFEADDGNAQHLSFDMSQLDDENAVPDEGCLAEKPEASETIAEEKDMNEASSSKHDQEVTKFESDSKYPILKKASHMLGAIPAPPFSSEYSTKDAAIRLHSQSSGSVRVTAGMIRISPNTSLAGGVMDWSYGKNGNINVVLSFGLVQEDAGSAVKTGSVLSWSFCLMLFWVLILSISFKIGVCIRSR